jgi:hypothetical protein
LLVVYSSKQNFLFDFISNKAAKTISAHTVRVLLVDFFSPSTNIILMTHENVPLNDIVSILSHLIATWLLPAWGPSAASFQVPLGPAPSAPDHGLDPHDPVVAPVPRSACVAYVIQNVDLLVYIVIIGDVRYSMYSFYSVQDIFYARMKLLSLCRPKWAKNILLHLLQNNVLITAGLTCLLVHGYGQSWAPTIKISSDIRVNQYMTPDTRLSATKRRSTLENNKRRTDTPHTTSSND